MGHISTKTELFAYTNKIYVWRIKEETLKSKNTDHFKDGGGRTIILWS